MKPVVLLVEDLEDDYLVFRRAFQRAEIPAELIWVKHGIEAREYLSGEPPYNDRGRFPLPVFVLLDLKMPFMTGFEVLDWIRSRPTLKRLPVVVLTSSGEEIDVNHAYDIGANSYLVKPTSFTDLQQVAASIKEYWFLVNRGPELHERSQPPPS